MKFLQSSDYGKPCLNTEYLSFLHYSILNFKLLKSTLWSPLLEGSIASSCEATAWKQITFNQQGPYNSL